MLAAQHAAEACAASALAAADAAAVTAAADVTSAKKKWVAEAAVEDGYQSLHQKSAQELKRFEAAAEAKMTQPDIRELLNPAQQLEFR